MAGGNAWAIEVEGLEKSFGHRQVLKGLDLRVRKGQFITLLGPNGAGKSTLIRILATLSTPSRGRITVNGFDPSKDARKLRQSIGVVSHETFLYDDLSGYENLKFYGKMYGLPDLEEGIHSLAKKVGLESRLSDRVHTLSHGMQKRLTIARALLHNPPLLLLDEPETGLDQQAAAMLMELVLSVETPEKRTVLMTTHSLERGLQMSDCIAILSRGKVAYEGASRNLDISSLAELYHRHTGSRQ